MSKTPAAELEMSAGSARPCVLGPCGHAAVCFLHAVSSAFALASFWTLRLLPSRNQSEASYWNGKVISLSSPARFGSLSAFPIAAYATGSAATAVASRPRTTFGVSSPWNSSMPLMHESFILPFATASIVSLIEDTVLPTFISSHSRLLLGVSLVGAPPSRLTESDVILLLLSNSLSESHTPAAIFRVSTLVGAARLTVTFSPTPSSGLPSHHAVFGARMSLFGTRSKSITRHAAYMSFFDLSANVELAVASLTPMNA